MSLPRKDDSQWTMSPAHINYRISLVTRMKCFGCEKSAWGKAIELHRESSKFEFSPDISTTTKNIVCFDVCEFTASNALREPAKVEHVSATCWLNCERVVIKISSSTGSVV